MADAADQAQNTQTAESQATDAAANAEQQARQPVAEATPAQQQPPAETPKSDEAAKPEGAPEKYDFKAPEGEHFNEKVIGAFEGIARELNLNNEGAQKVLDTVAPVLKAEQDAMIEQARQTWLEQTKADPEVGGEKFNESLATAVKAVERFGGDELKSFLDETGLGNHPAVVKTFHKIGLAISEDNRLPGGNAPESGTKDARSRYPNTKMNP